jgi:hypothetical protein
MGRKHGRIAGASKPARGQETGRLNDRTTRKTPLLQFFLLTGSVAGLVSSVETANLEQLRSRRVVLTIFCSESYRQASRIPADVKGCTFSRICHF